MDRISADPLLSILDGRSLGKQAHGTLGGLVLRTAMVSTDQAKLGGDIDDRATAPLPHRRNGDLGPQKNAFGVDVHDAIPLLDGRILDPTAPADPGVIDQDIELAKPIDSGLDCLLPILLVGDIEAHKQRYPASGIDLRL